MHTHNPRARECRCRLREVFLSVSFAKRLIRFYTFKLTALVRLEGSFPRWSTMNAQITVRSPKNSALLSVPSVIPQWVRFCFGHCQEIRLSKLHTLPVLSTSFSLRYSSFNVKWRAWSRLSLVIWWLVFRPDMTFAVDWAEIYQEVISNELMVILAWSLNTVWDDAVFGVSVSFTPVEARGLHLSMCWKT